MNEHIDPRDLEYFSEPDKVELIPDKVELITEQSHPRLFALFSEVADALCIPLPDKLYLNNSAEANWTSISGKTNNIDISKTAISILSPNNLKALIGHEMGHLAQGKPLRRLLGGGMILASGAAVMAIGSFCGLFGFGLAALAATTSLATSLLIDRHLEYDADKAGVKVTDADTMAETLHIAEAYNTKTSFEKKILTPEQLTLWKEKHGPDGLSLDFYKQDLLGENILGKKVHNNLKLRSKLKLLVDCHPKHQKRIQRLKNMKPQSHVERLESESEQIDNSPAIPQASA